MSLHLPSGKGGGDNSFFLQGVGITYQVYIEPGSNLSEPKMHRYVTTAAKALTSLLYFYRQRYAINSSPTNSPPKRFQRRFLEPSHITINSIAYEK